MSLEKTAVFFVGRLTSTRLPRKILLPIEDKPMMMHHFDRMKLAQKPERFILCTSTESADDELAAAAKEYGFDVFRGSESDVPGRLLNACKEFDIDTFILAETDEHFSDPDHVDLLLSHVETKGGDWVHINGNPIGAWIRAVSRHAMQTLCDDMDTDNLSGWGLYFDKYPDKFKLAEFQVFSDEDAAFNDKLRLTIDYPEDFELAVELYKRLYKPGTPLRLNEVLAELKAHPELIDINLHRQDHYEANIKAQSAGIIE